MAGTLSEEVGTAYMYLIPPSCVEIAMKRGLFDLSVLLPRRCFTPCLPFRNVNCRQRADSGLYIASGVA
jgi:hypothetical protein